MPRKLNSRVILIKTNNARSIRLNSVENSPVDNKCNQIVDNDNHWVGKPVPVEQAKQRWPHRYQEKPTKGITQAKCHYVQVLIDGKMFSLNDDVMVKAGDNQKDYICKIVELFESIDGIRSFTAQWYYRASDTAVCANLIHDECIFFSEIKDDNPLDCILDKAVITRSPIKACVKENIHSYQHFWCDKMYLLPRRSFGTFRSGKIQSGLAEDFLNLIEEWGKLCKSVLSTEATEHETADVFNDCESEENDEKNDVETESEVY